MPVMAPSGTGFSAANFTTNDTWQYVTLDLPEYATAIIVQFYQTEWSGTNWAEVEIMEAYPGETSTDWNSYSTGQAYLADDSQYNLMLAWNGYGSLVARGDSLNALLQSRVLGYFTEEEFVPFETRQTLTRNVGGANTTHDITQEDWFVPTATGYMCGSGGGILCNTGFKGTNQTNASHAPSVFWPDGNNEVWLYGNVDRTIPGYFKEPFVKGEDSRMRAFEAYLKPLTSTSETTLLSGHQMDPDYAFAIAYCEYNLSYPWPSLITAPAGQAYFNGVQNTLAGNFYGGRYWEEEIYCYPEQSDIDSGKMNLYFETVEYYNEDEFLLFAAFPRTSLVSGSGFLQYEQLVYGEPTVVEIQSIAMAVPVLYNTVPGDYTWSGTFVLYLSGGASNADPALSLGGAISTTAAGSNVFGSITNRKAQLGGDEYRCVYLKNTSSTETAYGLIVWIENQAQLGNEVSIGVDPAGVSESAQTVPNEDTTPVSVTFSQPSGVQNGLSLGIIAPGEAIPIWVRRTGDIQNVLSGSETVTLAFSVMTNG